MWGIELKRMKIYFSFTESGTFPINYNHLIMGVIYTSIKESDPEFADELHNSNLPKFFTFSQLRITKKKIIKDRISVFEGTKANFILSSADDRVIDLVFNQFIKEPVFKFSNLNVEIEAIKILDEPEITSPCSFKLLSPIVLSIPVEKNDKFFHKFLSPTEKEFSLQFVRNLKKKYKIFSGNDGGELYFIPNENYIKTHRTSKLLDIKGVKIKGHIFPFVLEGDPELIKFGYYAGFGERTAQGFGCAEVYKKGGNTG